MGPRCSLTSFEDGADLLYRLTQDANGTVALKRAMSLSDSGAYYGEFVVPFLGRLGQDDVCVGTLKNDLHDVQCRNQI